MISKFSVNALFVLYWSCGVVLAFIDLSSVGSSQYAEFVISLLPVVDSLSLGAVDHQHWRGYYVSMVTLMLPFCYFLWVACGTERGVVVHKYAKPLTVLWIISWLLVLFWLTRLSVDGSSAGVDKMHNGKRLITFVMIRYRFGLSIFGNTIISCYLVLLYVGVIAAVQALLFPKK